MSPIMIFIFGVLVGTPIGIFIMALMMVSSTADDALELGRRNRLGVRKCQ
jgi:hypothetical protein